MAEAFKVNTTLKKVDLTSKKAVKLTCDGGLNLHTLANNIGNAGASALAEAFKVNTTLESVDLRSESR